MRLTRIRQTVAVFPYFQEYEAVSQNVCARIEEVRDWARKLPNPVQHINVCAVIFKSIVRFIVIIAYKREMVLNQRLCLYEE